jgi:hypothetical protein
MSTLAYTVTDSATMLRRNLRRLQRYPSMTLLLVGMPIVFLLLFVYVFGGQLSHGLGNAYDAGHTGRAGYLNYVTPGILLMTVAAAVQGTAIVVAMDMTGGIIDRFRTMAIARSAVLTGHVLAALIQTILSLGVVLGVAVALGFRPSAGPLEWLAALGVLVLFSLAFIWLATALGSPPRASKPPATRRCSSPSSPSSAVASCSSLRCRPDSASSPGTNRSPLPPKCYADSSPEPRSAPTPSAPSPGASASPSPPSSGPGTSTPTGARPDPGRSPAAPPLGTDTGMHRAAGRRFTKGS